MKRGGVPVQPRQHTPGKRRQTPELIRTRENELQGTANHFNGFSTITTAIEQVPNTLVSGAIKIFKCPALCFLQNVVCVLIIGQELSHMNIEQIEKIPDIRACTEYITIIAPQ